jgi:hypothetical protein
MAAPRTPRDAIKQGSDNAKRFFADLAGADDPGTKAAARVLMREIRKQLSKRATPGADGKLTASNPGEAPRRRTGRLYKSVGQEVVGGIRRVGPASFKGRLLHEGVNTTVDVTPSGRSFDKRRRKSGKPRRTLIIEPRPFMDAALQQALPKMEGETVTALQARERTLKSYV